MIREALNSDAGAIAAIYNHYIVNTVITFETEPVSAAEIAARMEKYKKTGPYLVYEENGEVTGYAYVSKFRERKAYDHTLESTIYVKNGCGGRGIGSQLYGELLARLGKTCHVVIGCIALPNEASVGLHEKLGFSRVGLFTEVGRKFDAWIDVGFWQKTLSGRAGGNKTV